jgi:hypothetical protein
MSLLRRRSGNTNIIVVAAIVFGLLICIPAVSWAQMLEITPMIGWQWSAKVQGYDVEADFKDNANFAAYLGYQVIPNTFIEFSYTIMKTTGNLNYFSAPDEDLGDTYFHYFLIGGTNYFGQNRLQPFVLGSLGATWIDLKDNSTYDDTVLFALAFGGGLKAYITQMIGVRLQARLLMPISFNGVWFGTGGLGLTGNIMLQGDFSAGVVIGLGHESSKK